MDGFLKAKLKVLSHLQGAVKHNLAITENCNSILYHEDNRNARPGGPITLIKKYRKQKYFSSSSTLNTSTQAGDGLKNVLHGIRFGSKAMLEEWLGESLVDSIQTSLEICHIQQQGTRILVRKHSRFQHNLDCTRDLESSTELDAHGSSYFTK